MRSQVRVEVTAPIATVTLGESGRAERLDVRGWLQLAEAFMGLSGRGDVSCVVVHLVGEAPYAVRDEEAESKATRDQARLRAMAPALRAVRVCPHATVAAIDGNCTGPALELAACCDVRVCGDTSRFGVPLGGGEATVRGNELEPLVQLLGWSPLLEELMAGQLVEAERARKSGLVNRVFPEGTVLEHGYGMAARIAAGAPIVNPARKAVLRRLAERPRRPGDGWGQRPADDMGGVEGLSAADRRTFGTH